MGELWGGASRLSAPINADDQPHRANLWCLAWVVVFAVLLTACSGSPSPRSSASPSTSAREVASGSPALSTPGQVQPTPKHEHVQPSSKSPGKAQPTSSQSSPDESFTMPDLVGLTLAAARSALSAADAGQYSWVYGCYGSPNTGLVVKQSPAGGVSVPRSETVDFYLQANNC